MVREGYHSSGSVVSICLLVHFLPVSVRVGSIVGSWTEECW